MPRNLPLLVDLQLELGPLIFNSAAPGAVQRSLVSSGGHKAVLGRRPIALVVGVIKRLVFPLRVCFFQCSMISCGLSEDAREWGGQPAGHARHGHAGRRSYLTSPPPPAKAGSDTHARFCGVEVEEEEEGKGMARLQGAGRRLLVILLALFLLVAAPAQAARFTSIHLTLNYLCIVSSFLLSSVSLCIERLVVMYVAIALNCSCGDFDVDAGSFRARISEAPALEGSQVSAEVLCNLHAVLEQINILEN